jgi:D-beta-D-heptose 7-phosphate kinase/D-beta-D-heptose 1-phosphate adenosyltransferase
MRVSERRLAELIRRFPGVRVLVVGDLMLDRFVWGQVERISPEAPVPVVHVTGEDERPGGAGNVVSNIAALGGRAAACGVVGDDAAGKRLAAALRALGAATEGVVVSRHARTTEKTRIIAHHQQVVRLDHEESPPLDGAGTQRVRDFVLGGCARCDVVVVSDYAKGVIGPELLAALAEAHGRAPFTWVVDPKRPNFAHYRRASLMKPNRAEAAEAAGIEIRDRASLCAAGARLLERWETEAVLISRGEEGMALFRRGGVEEFPTVAREVYDVTGAGDTVLAACALALGAGGTLEEAALLANHAAGVVVGKLGTATLSGAELRAAITAGRPAPRGARRQPRGAREHWTGPRRS